MAVCLHCDYIYRGGTECPNCGMPAVYRCFNTECGAEIDASAEILCRRCHWYICPECGACGCDEDRPMTRSEKGEGWDEEDLW